MNQNTYHCCQVAIQALFQINQDIVLPILGACKIWRQFQRFVFVEQKFKFFVNYDKWSQKSRNFYYEAFKRLICNGFQRFDQKPSSVVHLDWQRPAHPSWIENQLSHLVDCSCYVTTNQQTEINKTCRNDFASFPYHIVFKDFSKFIFSVIGFP